MPTIYLGIGSNIGDRQQFLKDAINRLAQELDVIRVSSFYLTQPWGNEDQTSFINAVVEARTSQPPEELLAFIKSIESSLGRKHRKKWGPREIDIDILFYGYEKFEQKNLEIPHPHIPKRAFVLVPLAEIAPEFIHPLLEKTIAELAAGIDKKGIKRLDSEAI